LVNASGVSEHYLDVMRFSFHKFQIDHSREVYSFFAALGDYGGVQAVVVLIGG